MQFIIFDALHYIRWLLSEAGVSRDLLLAFRICSDRFGTSSDSADVCLLEALSLAIGRYGSRCISAYVILYFFRILYRVLADCLSIMISHVDIIYMRISKTEHF